MPGPQDPKLIALDSIGRLLIAGELEHETRAAGSDSRLLFRITKKNRCSWTAAFVDDLGLAVVSHQTGRSFLIEPKTLVELALEAGIDDHLKGAIILPEGRHGL